MDPLHDPLSLIEPQADIDPRAVIDPDARIAAGVHVGPYSVIGPDVEIGEGTWIGPHVVLNGPTRIGCDNRIHQFCSLGDDPQDKKYRGERAETRLQIGDRNTIREYCTMNRGTVQGGGVTRIGDDNWIMAYVHIAHDCIIGNHTVFANGASLAGHVVVEDHAILGGFTLVHQFCRIGAYSFSAFSSTIAKDLPPYMMVSRESAKAHGLNREGLRRHGCSPETIDLLRRAYRILYRENLTVAESLALLREMVEECPEVQRLVDFVAQSTRGIIR
ncbi:MAG: acyl-ACP--UDP-N-acetylglucosamine O-acyltransferase [Pseudomonadota bacterium]|nr:acyl-ACP--UDP-N-acetylglucosamine O-acyltransferase [Pseudomonadota bacterium]